MRRACHRILVALAALVLLLATASAHAERLKDLAGIQGVRSNQLIGYGLVVGLDNTGDQTTQTPFTTQSLNSMLAQLGITIAPGTSMQLKNVAAVMVTAPIALMSRLPPDIVPTVTGPSADRLASCKTISTFLSLAGSPFLPQVATTFTPPDRGWNMCGTLTAARR